LGRRSPDRQQKPLHTFLTDPDFPPDSFLVHFGRDSIGQVFSMDGSSQQGSWWKRNGWTFVLVALAVLLAGALRVTFNYEPAINDGSYRYAGNDDYYHLRVVQNTQETGGHTVVDPLLNYPVPYRNPRPPLYDWHVAVFGQILGFLSGEASPGEPALEAGQYALEWGSAFWGALTVIPIWLIGRATFGNRVGIWAGFLIAASPAHIQRSGFGLGDHDAFIVFFLCLGAYFLVRALQLTRDDNRVERWNSLDSVANGFGTYITTHREGLAYAFLAGVSWAAIGLAWEGFPYVLALYAIYYTFQLISNQVRRRDSTGDALVFATIIGLMIAVTLPYYWIHGNIGGTLNSMMYLVAILAILGIALIPTRDLPAILVLPGLAVIGVLGLLVLLFVVPDIGRLLLSANGYFNQSKLYSTIAEAQRTELGVFVFSVGFMTFFFAIYGFFAALWRYFKVHERAMLFLVAWGVLSLYMGFAATRFIFNAAPVFSVLGAWTVVRIVDWMNFKERMKSFQSLRHESFFKATRSTFGAKQIFGILLLLFTLVIPNLWFSVDAGIPTEARLNYRQNHPGSSDLIDNRTGAFGQGFLQNDWLVVYGWLADQDQDLAPRDRPAHMAWWDYGFWEVAIAGHPTVADNFQNGYELSGRFLASQSEKEGIDFMSARLIEGDFFRTRPAGMSSEMSSFLDGFHAGWAAKIAQAMPLNQRYDPVYEIFQENLTTLERSVEFYEGLQDVTGFSIEYFLVDNRMLPYDNPQTQGIEAGSILYAPIFLANKNPDDFVQTVYVDARQNEYMVKAYTTDANGNSIQENPVKIVDQTGRCYFVSGGLLYRADDQCEQIDYSFNGGQGLQLQGTRLELKDQYYNTMFYKGFVGGDKPAFGDYPPELFQGVGTPGAGLKHFRFVNGTSSVKLLQYYEGAVVTGKASSSGQSLTGFQAVAIDPFGFAHDNATIGADGSFKLLAPFNLAGEDKVKIVIRQAGATSGEVANQTVDISLAAARREADYNFSVEFNVQPATLTGIVYEDVNRDGSYNASLDKPMDAATVTVDGKSTPTGADGHFSISDLLPGTKSVQAAKTGYQNGTGGTTIPAGGTGNITIAMRPANIPVNGTLLGQNDAPLASFTVRFEAVNPTADRTSNTTAVTNAQGVFTGSLSPGGEYKVIVDDTTIENNVTVRYKGETTIDVPLGSPAITIGADKLVLTRTEE
jgi:dolichyl-phosphooligosaccharide-protein glycotransferase